MRKEKRLKTKIVSALLVLTVAFTMAGCNNNNKGLGTYVAFANKAKTKIFIVNKEAGKSTNKEYYVYEVKSKKLKTINKAYPETKIKKFAKMLKKQQKGWKKINKSKKLKDVVYVSKVDGKTYKIFVKKAKKKQ